MYLIRCLLLGLCLGILGRPLWAQPAPTHAFEGLQEGDLLFQDLDCGSFCQAIEAVTEGRHGKDFSHIGLVVRDDDQWKVLEAVSAGVRLVHLDRFLNRSLDDHQQPKVWVGRTDLSAKARRQAVQWALQQLGAPYDDAFVIDNDRYYCSELIRDAFQTEAGHYLFEWTPMTFIDPETGRTFPVWKSYYQNLHRPIPEGAPGINPGLISRSPHVRIVHRYDETAGAQVDQP